MNELAIQELSNTDLIRSRIFTIRGVQIMFDRDLAELYGVATKALNQAVKRNIERFPERYMFQLNKDDVANMRSQIVTLNSDNPGSILRSQIVTSRFDSDCHCLRSRFVTLHQRPYLRSQIVTSSLRPLPWSIET